MTTISCIAGIILILVVLWDAFETIVLPRRVVRRVRLTRFFYRYTWLAWSWTIHRVLSGRRMETMLGVYGPLSLLLLLSVWAAGLVFGFALLHWAAGSITYDAGGHSFATALYFSGTTLFTLGLGDARPVSAPAKVLTVIESGMGLGFLALVIGYLPALYQSFSRRERDISMLDTRAGSPPTAVQLLGSHAHEGGTEELRRQLADWELWSAELLESHLSYPVLAYYRSQHDEQSWLAALTAILDTSALVIAGVQGTCRRQAELTFAMARHAVVDLSAVFNQPPRKLIVERLTPDDLIRLRSMLRSAGLVFNDEGKLDDALGNLRRLYEPYVFSLADFFCLDVPDWIPKAGRLADWQTSVWEEGADFYRD